jgi:anti-sigma regulatory factor (Ser/Thr protein kinase)
VVPDTPTDGFRHALSMYTSPEHAAECAAPYLMDGHEAGETLIVQVSPDVRECLASTFDGPALAASIDLGDVVDHPHQTLWALRQLADEAMTAGARLRVLFELDATANDPLDWARAEAAANAVLAGRPIRELCVCDVMATHRLVLADLMWAHPDLWHDGVSDANPEYIDAGNHLRSLDARRSPDPLEAWPAKQQIALADIAELAAVRSALEPMLQRAGIADARQEDFLEGVFQVCVNAIMHGGDMAEVRLWDTEASVLCRVRDDGAGPADPLMGYVPPKNGLSSPGTSLWAARQLCDHLTTTIEPEGFTVRMTVNA